MFRRVFNLLILVLVSLVIDEAITATTSRIRVLNQPWAASSLLRNTFDEVDNLRRECQCVIFYLCDSYNWDKNDTLCEDPAQVCCKTNMEEESDSTPPTTVPDHLEPLPSLYEEPNVDNESPPSSFPSIVAILRSNISTNGIQTLEYFCSGSLLSQNVILTAAHCLENLDPSMLRIRAGVYNMNDNINYQLPYQERVVGQITIHENFSSEFLENDLALLSVDEPFNYESHIGRICAPLDGSPCTSLVEGSYNPEKCILVGWGKTAFEIEGNSRVLEKKYVDLMPNDQCENIFLKVHPSSICAKGENSDDVCESADGGAPLVCPLTSSPTYSKYVQVGVFSRNIGCFNAFPSIYASLKKNTEWLNTEFNNLNEDRSIYEKLFRTSTT